DESKPEAASLSVGSGLGAETFLEDLAVDPDGDPRAGIVHLDHQLAILLVDRDADPTLAGRSGGVEGVVDEVAQERDQVLAANRRSALRTPGRAARHHRFVADAELDSTLGSGRRLWQQQGAQPRVADPLRPGLRQLLVEARGLGDELHGVFD